MKQVLLFVETKFVIPLEKISAQRHLAAIRDGLLSVFPFSLIGSLFLLITSLPLPATWAIKSFIDARANVILVPYRMTTVLITLYMVVSVGAALARSYNFNAVSGSLVAMVSYLMTQMPMNPALVVPSAFLRQAAQSGLDVSWYAKLEEIGWVLQQTPMSGIGVYVGAVSAIIGVEILHLNKWFFQSIKGVTPRATAQIPDAILQTIETIVPITLVVIVTFVIRHVIGLDMQKIVLSFFSAFIGSANSLPGALFFVLLMSLFSFFGIIGFSVQGSAASVAWLTLMEANTLAFQTGSALPNVAPLPFFQFFIWIGGTGAILSLVTLLCFSKSGYLRKLGLGCLAPSLFNVNTPVIYGLPIILNPYMFIPFVLAPMATTIVSYLAMWLNLIGRPHSSPAASIPFFAGAFLSTGDWKAILLCLVNFFVSMLIYYPFFKMYEKKLIADGENKAKQLALKQDGKLKATHIE